MPEQPPEKRRSIIVPLEAAQRAPETHPRPAPAVPYAELHCKSNFSFLRGASHADELVKRAVELGYTALAIADRNTLAGVVRAHVAAKDASLKLLVGAEITPSDAPPVVLLAMDRRGYAQLARLITTGRRRAPKGECHLTCDDIAAHADGLLALLDPMVTPSSPTRPGASIRRMSPIGPLRRYRHIFGDRCYLLAELHLGPDDEQRLGELIDLSEQARMPLVASNDVHYHEPARRYLQDVLVAVREGCTVAAAGDRLFSNGERYLKPPPQMAELFGRVPEAVRRTVEVAGRCSFSLDELRYEYPEELAPAGLRPIDYLTQLTGEGARRRYPGGLPDKVRRLVEHELALIAELRYEAYFLTVWDLVQFARSRGILCQGRGSAANSAVCYMLGVTAVDPDRIDVLFERFVSRERNEAPDIDVDFEHERREEVLQYIYDKYGRERAGMTAEVISYRARSAIRDVGKALGLSLDRINVLAKGIDCYGDESHLTERCREVGLDPAAPVVRQMVGLTRELIGFPRHLGQHVGGMVITQGPLCELAPIENAAMPGRTVIEWDKDDLDALGILKVDCLALGMLTAIHKCFDLVERHQGRRLALATVPAEDPAVYEMIDRADTVGVFQIESRAQMSMLPQLRPRCFYDLVIEVAIVRPGPIQGDMVHPYLRRRAGLESVTYPNAAIEAVLSKTLGVPLFQEQAMRLAMVAAGFTPGEADQLRRAMGAWRRPGLIETFRQKLVNGMLANGLSPEFAERVFHQIRGFGEYGFPESHAASFALLVYISAWLKRYHPAAFTCALLNSQPMGFYAPAQLVRDAQEHGVAVRPVDVNTSTWDCTLESGTVGPDPSDMSDSSNSPAIRLGFRMIRGLSRAQFESLAEIRGTRPFRSIAEFTRRTGLSSAVIARLSEADAFSSLGLDRRLALWDALGTHDPLPLFGYQEADEPAVSLRPLSLEQEVVADYQTAGLSLRAHPLSLVREDLDRLRVTPASRLAGLADGRYVRVAGLVLVRQRPGTASGITFVTLEDETGIANLIVRPAVWERHRRAARTAQALLAHGRLERQDDVIHILVGRLEDLSDLLADIGSQSRDFR